LQLFANNFNTVDCADVEFWTEYELETQPAIIKKRQFRSFGCRAENQFVFVKEPPGTNTLLDELHYCGKYLKTPFPKPHSESSP
jgi:hypothetical protein